MAKSKKRGGLVGWLAGLISKPKLAAPTSQTRKPWETVYVTLSGKCYHYDPDCPTLRGAKTHGIDRAKAKASSMTLCKKCADYWNDVW